MVDHRSSLLASPPVELVSRPPPPPRRRQLLAAAALAAGLGIGYLAGAYTGDDGVPRAPTTSLAATSASDESTTSTTEARSPVTDLLPGLEARRILAVETSGGLSVLELPADGTRTRRTDLGFGPGQPARVEFDASGRWMSVRTHSVFERVLYVGSLQERPSPASLEVGSSAWHPTQAGRLAWITTLPEGSSMLVRGQVHAGGVDRRALAEVGGSAELVGWGAWGFLLALDFDPEDGCHALVHLDEEGSELATRSGIRYLDSSPGGRLLMEDCRTGAVILSDASFGSERVLDWAPSEARIARWGPSERHIMFVGETDQGAFLAVHDTDGRYRASMGVPRPLSVEWSLTGPAVLAGRGGVVVIADIPTMQTVRVPIGERLLTAALR